MKTICAWCGTLLKHGEVPEASGAPISHGICQACAGKLLSANPSSMNEFLNHFDFPVLLVKAELGIEIANRSACAMLGRNPESFKGKWPGDVAECIYAKESDGCGRHTCCTGCTIRKTLLDTFATGRNHLNVAASITPLPREMPQPAQILVSTEKVGDFVLLRLEKIQTDPQKSQN